MPPKNPRANIERLRQKRRIRMRFKATVRMVAFHKLWLNKDYPPKDGQLGLNERSILLQPPEKRTQAEHEAVIKVLLAAQAFKRFAPKTRIQLAKVVRFQFSPKGHCIIKEGHTAENMYFILEGKIEVTRKFFNKKEGRYVEKPLLNMKASEIFGELSLLDNQRRRYSLSTLIPCELLVCKKDDFNYILKDVIILEWKEVYMALNRFEYFKHWPYLQKRECVFISKIVEYKPNEVVLGINGEGQGLTFFLLSGICIILQGITLKSSTAGKEKFYKMCKIEKKITHKVNIMNEILKQASKKQKYPSSAVMYQQKSVQSFRSSDEENEKGKFDMIEGDTKQIFIEVAQLAAGSVFGLGERYEEREIVAKTRAQLLAIPTYWLYAKRQNHANIWNRTVVYLDKKIPSRKHMYEYFLGYNKWLVQKDILMKYVRVKPISGLITKVEDIPIVSRILRNS